jgi:hypothetical protein
VLGLLPCVDHVAGTNANSDDCDESVNVDETSSMSLVGVLPRVEEGTKRSSSSLSMLDIDWRGPSLVQPVFGN